MMGRVAQQVNVLSATDLYTKYGFKSVLHYVTFTIINFF